MELSKNTRAAPHLQARRISTPDRSVTRRLSLLARKDS